MIPEYPLTFAMRLPADLDSKVEVLRGARRRKEAAPSNLRLRSNAAFAQMLEDLRISRRPVPTKAGLIKALVEEAFAREGGALRAINGQGVLDRSALIRHLVEAEHRRVFASKKRRHK